MASQIVNNRSACGIVEFDDGAGGLLSGGRLTCSHMDTITSEFDYISVLNNFNLQGTMTVAGTTITPTWLSYLYGLTGNIQTQLNTVIGTHLGANNIWTGINTYTNSVNFSGATIYGLSRVSVGLPNVDNTADSAKPISNAQAAVNTTTSNAITANTNAIAANTTKINSNTTKIATNTANIATNAANIATNSTNIATNTADILLNTSDIATNTADIATNTSDIADLQTSYTIQSLAVGTTTTGEEGTNASVLNVGTAKNQVLNFTIPRGYRGYKGDQGDRGAKGDDGKDGSDGSNGSNGDSSAATASAAVAGASAVAAATAAGASAASAASASASAAASAASAALNNVEVQEIKVKLNALDLEVNQLDTDVATLKQKTQNITGTSTLTLINSELQTNQINATGLYVADSIIVAGEVKATTFSGGLAATNIGGLTNTNIKGPAINIGTSEVLFNTVTIGSASSVVTINGIVNYTNPFNNFFEQW